MIPVLFKVGPFSVYSYGLMLGMAFLLGSYVLSLELKRRKLDPNIASTITIISVIAGIAGAKLLFLIESWNFFVRDPFGMIFSPGGLTWYGGFIVGMIAIYVYIKRKKVPYLKFLDCLGVALIIAYGVGRLGCHFSGDGDYGYPSRLPWATIYAQGTSKPAYALEEYFQQHPEQRTFWHYDSLRVIPAGVDRMGNRVTRFDEVTPLHPVPVYEMLLGVAGFAILWILRKKEYPDGTLFMIYLILASAFRFCIEFLRLNPRLLFGLSEAQLFSIVISLVAGAGIVYVSRKPGTTAS